jgi:hypothetical protein
MSASLIGRLGLSAFRLSTITVSMSLTGSCFSSESAPNGHAEVPGNVRILGMNGPRSDATEDGPISDISIVVFSTELNVIGDLFYGRI